MKMIHAFALAAMVMMAYGPHVSGSSLLSGPFAPEPDTPQSEFLKANEPTIMQLAAQAKMGDTQDRRAALETLAISYSDASLNLASELITDSDTGIAMDSAKLLAATLAMIGPVTTDGGMHSAGTFALRRIDAAVGSLRLAIGDRRVEVRSIAAGTLAAIGDRGGLEKIEDCVKRGVVSDLEAIGYFGVAPNELGSKYIERYLKAESKEARAAAVGYLGTDPSYQDQIRALVLNGSDAEEEVLQKAAAVLGRYDRKFPSYALDLVGRAGLPPLVSDTVARSYVMHALAAKKHSTSDWKERVREIDAALMRYPTTASLQMIKAELTNGDGVIHK